MLKENQLFNRGYICLIYDENNDVIASCDSKDLAQSIIKFDKTAKSYKIIPHIGGKIIKDIDLLKQIKE